MSGRLIQDYTDVLSGPLPRGRGSLCGLLRNRDRPGRAGGNTLTNLQSNMLNYFASAAVRITEKKAGLGFPSRSKSRG